MHKLDQFQIEGVEFMLKNIHALNADDTGLGKTVQTIECINKIKAGKIFICCLAGVKYYWRAMLWEWLTVPYHKIQIIDTRKDIIDTDADIIIVNYELMICKAISEQLRWRKFDIGVCDEAHYLQTLDAQRTKALLGRDGVIKNCDYKFMLSATPLDRPKHLFPMLKSLANDLIAPYNTYQTYAFRYCDGYIEARSQELVADGASNLSELKEKLKGFMIRRTEAHGRPPCQFRVLPIRPNKAIRDLIQTEQGFSEQEESELARVDFETQGDMVTHRREVALAKLPECIDYIKELLLYNHKLVVFAYHRDVMKALKKALENFGVCMVIGGMGAKKKHQEIQMFTDPYNEGSKRVFLGQVMAAGESIDGLQKVCNYGVFIESSWLAKDLKQPIGRLVRKMQKFGRVFFDFLAVEGTIEYQVLGSVFKKQKNIDYLMGG